MTRNFLKPFLFALALCALSGCVSQQDAFENGMVKEAQVTDTTRSSRILMNLPLPVQRVPVSVYEFQDQTGQFKPNDRLAEYSSAVTKGGLAVFVKALLDAGNREWFMVTERGGLRNLLQERQIVRTMRNEYVTPDGAKLPDLPPLVYGGILLEGGIIFYDSNVMTGGAGARYFGIGGSTEYRRDLVTVYLRATSVQTGEVLMSVTSSKTIFSYALSANVSRFLSFDKLLEAEAGFTVNEPSQLAVRQAIETAVYSMIMEGAMTNLWQFEDAEAGANAVAEYVKRRDGKEPSQEEIDRFIARQSGGRAPVAPAASIVEEAPPVMEAKQEEVSAAPPASAPAPQAAPAPSENTVDMPAWPRKTR